MINKQLFKSEHMNTISKHVSTLIKKKTAIEIGTPQNNYKTCVYSYEQKAIEIGTPENNSNTCIIRKKPNSYTNRNTREQFQNMCLLR